MWLHLVYNDLLCSLINSNSWSVYYFGFSACTITSVNNDSLISSILIIQAFHSLLNINRNPRYQFPFPTLKENLSSISSLSVALTIEVYNTLYQTNNIAFNNRLGNGPKTYQVLISGTSNCHLTQIRSLCKCD